MGTLDLTGETEANFCWKEWWSSMVYLFIINPNANT